MEIHDDGKVIGERCIYCGSTENVHAFCKVQHHGGEEEKVCYSVCPNCVEHIEKSLEPDVPCETCSLCGEKTEVYAFCTIAPKLEEEASEKVCYCVCPDCVAKLQDRVFDYYDEILSQGYVPLKKG